MRKLRRVTIIIFVPYIIVTKFIIDYKLNNKIIPYNNKFSYNYRVYKLNYKFIIFDKNKMFIYIMMFIYVYFNIWYIIGMYQYIIFNYNHNESELCWLSLIAECHELQQAYLQLSFVDIILESSDVIHAYVKYIFSKYLPYYLYLIIWIVVFPVVLPTTLKLSWRYRTYHCIRNHYNKNNCNHICNYNKLV